MLLKTKLKNQLCKYLDKDGLNCDELHNININGCKRGCSGNIYYAPTNTTVYVDTETNVISEPMFRHVKEDCIFDGTDEHSITMQRVYCRNQFFNMSDFIVELSKALKREDSITKWVDSRKQD